jgi:hypothetical protein
MVFMYALKYFFSSSLSFDLLAPRRRVVAQVQEEHVVEDLQIARVGEQVPELRVVLFVQVHRAHQQDSHTQFILWSQFGPTHQSHDAVEDLDGGGQPSGGVHTGHHRLFEVAYLLETELVEHREGLVD